MVVTESSLPIYLKIDERLKKKLDNSYWNYEKGDSRTVLYYIMIDLNPFSKNRVFVLYICDPDTDGRLPFDSDIVISRYILSLLSPLLLL